MIFVGLDLHKRYITACALDALGQLIAEERRLATDLAVLLAWLGRLTGPVIVVLEATLYWAWLEQRLTAAGYTVQVAHPYQVKLIWHARSKTDPWRKSRPHSHEWATSFAHSSCPATDAEAPEAGSGRARR